MMAGVSPILRLATMLYGHQSKGAVEPARLTFQQTTQSSNPLR
jgi:hypothetical protein